MSKTVLILKRDIGLLKKGSRVTIQACINHCCGQTLLIKHETENIMAYCQASDLKAPKDV